MHCHIGYESEADMLIQSSSFSSLPFPPTSFPSLPLSTQPVTNQNTCTYTHYTLAEVEHKTAHKVDLKNNNGEILGVL